MRQLGQLGDPVVVQGQGGQAAWQEPVATSQGRQAVAVQ